MLPEQRQCPERGSRRSIDTPRRPPQGGTIDTPRRPPHGGTIDTLRRTGTSGDQWRQPLKRDNPGSIEPGVGPRSREGLKAVAE
jgi:hypothetical protein